MIESKWYLPLFYILCVLPMLIAAVFMGPFLRSYVFIGGLLVFLFSSLWNLSGWGISSFIFGVALLLGDFYLLQKIQPALFFVISIVSSLTVALLQSYILEETDMIQKENEGKIKELIQSLDLARKESFFALEDLESLEKEIFLKEMEEDPNQIHLINLLKQEQVYTQDLEQEIAALEMMITKVSFSSTKQRVRVKKIKQEKGEWFLPIEFQD